MMLFPFLMAYQIGMRTLYREAHQGKHVHNNMLSIIYGCSTLYRYTIVSTVEKLKLLCNWCNLTLYSTGNRSYVRRL